MERLSLSYPVSPHVVTHPWGVVDQRFGFLRHNGIDLALSDGQDIYAPMDGTVSYVGYHAQGSGRFLCLLSDRAYGFPDGTQARVELTFMHLSEALPKEGTRVRRGDRIAQGGNTGTSDTPHVHLAAKRVKRGLIGYRDLDRNDADNTFDPLPYWDGTYALEHGRKRHDEHAR
jgi:murein DD-endopeptidase MepM/ murein hydrolase activator NlpD